MPLCYQRSGCDGIPICRPVEESLARPLDDDADTRLPGSFCFESWIKDTFIRAPEHPSLTFTVPASNVSSRLLANATTASLVSYYWISLFTVGAQESAAKGIAREGEFNGG